MNSKPIAEVRSVVGVEPCPWCGKYCMYVETDGYTNEIRIGADCDEHFAAFESEQNDTFGNSFGRGEWAYSVTLAVQDWNGRVRDGRECDQQGVW